MDFGHNRSLDKEVWNYARNQDYLIVTKDVDFSEFSLLRGFPPKVIWIRRGNCSTHDIEIILREKFHSLLFKDFQIQQSGTMDDAHDYHAGTFNSENCPVVAVDDVPILSA